MLGPYAVVGGAGSAHGKRETKSSVYNPERTDDLARPAPHMCLRANKAALFSHQRVGVRDVLVAEVLVDGVDRRALPININRKQSVVGHTKREDPEETTDRRQERKEQEWPHEELVENIRGGEIRASLRTLAPAQTNLDKTERGVG